MNRNQCVATVVGLIAAMLAIVIPTYVVTVNATERARDCVENGGSYLHVADTSYMECQR